MNLSSYTFRISVKALAFLGILLTLNSCTRYSNLPRKRVLFQNESNSGKAKRENPSNELILLGERTDTTIQNVFTVIDETKPAISPKFSVKENHSSRKHKNEKKHLSKTLQTLIGGSRPLLSAVSDRTVLFRSFHTKPLPDDEKPEKEYHIPSIISFAAGILAWISFFLFIVLETYFFLFISEYLLLISFFLAISAIVMGIVSLSLTNKQKERYNNRYMAWIGLGLGGIEILFFFVGIVLLFLIFGF
ncbi:MAG: hypothetical protein H6605_01575 [Flavobacteriales bacterium]|nr:hypothetical protein [Flavobacteriales bacterium]